MKKITLFIASLLFCTYLCAQNSFKIYTLDKKDTISIVKSDKDIFKLNVGKEKVEIPVDYASSLIITIDMYKNNNDCSYHGTILSYDINSKKTTISLSNKNYIIKMEDIFKFSKYLRDNVGYEIKIAQLPKSK